MQFLAEINHFAPLLKLHAILTEILLFESNINETLQDFIKLVVILLELLIKIP
jgi:hypothetical protein